MQNKFNHLLSDLWVVGINYRNTNAEIRGRFAVNNEEYTEYLNHAKSIDATETFIISTCNRTEIYGYTKNIEQLITEYCEAACVDKNEFIAHSYKKNGIPALKHMLQVAAGLDSQILGDYEIVGQIKNAFNVAKEQGTTDIFTNRIFNTILQSSREIRAKTEISSGSVSVAFAASQFVKQHLPNIENSKVLILGAGEIGRNTALNLKDFMPSEQISIANRTFEKAQLLAEEIGGQAVSYTNFDHLLSAYDAIVVATNSDDYIINLEQLVPNKHYVLVDLAIPHNINPNVQLHPNVNYANVDDISKMNDETLKNRAKEIPKVENIIDFHIKEFIDWLNMRQHVPVIKEVKEKLLHLNNQYEADDACCNQQVIQKAINTMALKLKDEHHRKPGCNYIETFVDYLANAEISNSVRS